METNLWIGSINIIVTIWQLFGGLSPVSRRQVFTSQKSPSHLVPLIEMIVGSHSRKDKDWTSTEIKPLFLTHRGYPSSSGAEAYGGSLLYHCLFHLCSANRNVTLNLAIWQLHLVLLSLRCIGFFYPSPWSFPLLQFVNFFPIIYKKK